MKKTEIRTYSQIACTPYNAQAEAVSLCNELAKANGSVADVFKMEKGDIVLLKGSLANSEYSKGVYAVLFMVDCLDSSSIGYTHLYKDGPFRIVSSDWNTFISEMREL